ncbi:unnamed protein product [Nippostrongylus brasiliensis]|uniref:RNase H domain-containing protein n=1 Tax=Nippostrongylus brasiliensis TaxID=27835 RepID=A0A0N4XM72_NIPBR|nr:unnamed protein product [Nippostrongylus brasiliensis]
MESRAVRENLSDGSSTQVLTTVDRSFFKDVTVMQTIFPSRRLAWSIALDQSCGARVVVIIIDSLMAFLRNAL